jgi:hypothetical protein
MAHIMRLLTGLLFIALMATLAMAQLRVEPVAPIPSWCGGSYHVTGGLADKEYIEMVKSGQGLSSGTNFGACEDVVKEVRGLDGNVNEVHIPTYPAVPTSQVSFEDDGRVLNYTGEVDKDGKAVVNELKLPEISK